MKIKTTLIICWFLLSSVSTFAQRQPLPDDFKFFLDADIGGFLYDETFYFHGAVGFGYRLSEIHSVGAEYRRNNKAGCCNIYSMQGTGGFYRFKKGKWVGKFSTGFVLDGTRTWDLSDVHEYKGSGHYLSGEVKFHFAKAFRAGLFYTRTRNMNFDYYIFESNGIADELIYDRVETVGFPVFGVTVGATLPSN